MVRMKWSWADLTDCPDDIVEALVEILNEKAETPDET